MRQRARATPAIRNGNKQIRHPRPVGTGPTALRNPQKRLNGNDPLTTGDSCLDNRCEQTEKIAQGTPKGQFGGLLRKGTSTRRVFCTFCFVSSRHAALGCRGERVELWRSEAWHALHRYPPLLHMPRSSAPLADMFSANARRKD
jgi:hypothetical protein